MLGLALIDQLNHTVGSGWYSLDGGKPERANSLSDFPDGVTWVTNLAYITLTNLEYPSRFKNKDFLGIKIDEMLKDLGAPEIITDIEAMPILSQAFKNLSAFYLNHIKLDYQIPVLNLHGGLREYWLPSEMVKTKALDSALKGALLNSVQATTVIQRETYKKGKKTCIRLNPYAHLHRVLDAFVPLGTPSLINALQMGTTNSQRVSFLMNNGFLFFARLVDIKPKHEDAKIFAFGSGSANARRSMDQRVYVSNNEFSMMVDLYEFEIESAYCYSDFKYVEDPIWKILTGFPSLGSATVSGSIFFNMLLKARLDKWADKDQKKPALPYEMYSVQAAVFNDRDRILTYLAARDLAAAGAEVHSYRNGYVLVDLPEEVAPFVHYCNERGFEAPLGIQNG